MVDAVVAQALTVYQDYVTSGVPSSGPNDPSKADVRALWTALGNVLDAFSSSPGAGFAGFATLAAMNADLNYVANSIGQVFADGTPANDGTYLKLGSSGSGSWSQVSTLTLAGLLIAITAETTRAEAAEATLTANLASEATSRAAADAALTTNLAAEAATRAAADLLLTPLTFTSLAIAPSRNSYPLNGSTAVWADQLVANGGSLPSASYNDVQEVEYMLRSARLLKKLIYFNPFAGGNMPAAQTPLVDRFGNRMASVISGSGFSEGAGLTGVVLGLGIIPDYADLAAVGIAIGAYLLSNMSSSIVPVIGCYDYSVYGLFPNFGGLQMMAWTGSSYTGGNVSSPLQYEYGDGSSSYFTQGIQVGARDAAGRAFLYFNNVQRAVQAPVINTSLFPTPVSRMDISSPLSTDAIQINSTQGALGGAFIGRGDWTADEVYSMGLILQYLNQNLATPRAVYPDGLT
jgi:hypothetical protein